MVQFGIGKRIMIVDPHKENYQVSFSIDEEEYDRNGEALTSESSVTEKTLKRESLCSSENEKMVPAWCKRQKRSRFPTNTNTSRAHKNASKNVKPYTSRWSTERYNLGEANMFRIMKEEGAVAENPILRSKLRLAARKYIGDTGLLDHLLKHMDGKVAPMGKERFRRRHNFEGNMEYWLENADLANMRKEAGIKDPFWVPPSGWVPGDGHSQELVFAVEIKLLKEEMAKIKRDLKELVAKKQDVEQANVTPNSSSATNLKKTLNELMRWKIKTEQELMEISTTLMGVQKNYDLENWKSKIEQKLTEISNSLSNVQVPLKQDSSVNLSASEYWADCWTSTDNISLGGDLFDLKLEDFSSWLDTSDLVTVKAEPIVSDSCPLPAPVFVPKPSQGLVCGSELELLKQEISKMKRAMQDLRTPNKQDIETNVTPDSSVDTNSKFDCESSILMFEDMYEEIVSWKARIEQQVTEISSTLRDMCA